MVDIYLPLGIRDLFFSSLSLWLSYLVLIPYHLVPVKSRRTTSLRVCQINHLVCEPFDYFNRLDLLRPSNLKLNGPLRSSNYTLMRLIADEEEF